MKSLLMKIIYGFIGAIAFITWPQTMLAADCANPKTVQDKLDCFGTSAGYTTGPAYTTAGLAGLIGGMVKILLAFLGVIFLILILISGFKWMTTSSPDEIKKIRAKIINATIGLVIILASYAITFFIMQQLTIANPNPGLNVQ